MAIRCGDVFSRALASKLVVLLLLLVDAISHNDHLVWEEGPTILLFVGLLRVCCQL